MVLRGIVELDDLFQPFKSNPKLQTFLFPSMLVQIEAINLIGLWEMIFRWGAFYVFKGISGNSCGIERI